MKQPPASTSTPADLVRLPGGRHQIPAHQVYEHQRTRLIGAIARLGLERGYANVVIADIVTRAAVSKATFYRFYRSKEDCLFDAHKRHSAALIAALERAYTGERSAAQLRAGIRAILSYLSAHPPAAHLLTVGILSCGPRGAHRYSVMVEAMRRRLLRCGEFSRQGPALAAVLFASSTIAQTSLPPEEIDPSSLESELVEAFIGADVETHLPCARIG